MIDLEKMHIQAKKIVSILRLQSMPLSLKMLKSEDMIPEGAQRPVEDMGYHLSFCQVLALSRRKGLSIAATKEDMWCFEPVIGLGITEPPQRFLEGHNRFPDTARSLEAGATWAQNMPRLDYGIYSGVVSAPLEIANFEPDIFLIYADPAKMTQIAMAKNWLDGRDITTTISGHAACVFYVVPAMKNKQWYMAIPCGGDLNRAACEDYNMIFSAPIEALDDLVTGLEAIYNKGLGLPIQHSLSIEYNLEKSYVEMAKLIGMNWVK